MLQIANIHINQNLRTGEGGDSSRAGIPSAAVARTGVLYLPILLLIRDVYCVLCPYGFFLHKYIRLLSSSELRYPREKA